MSHCRFQCRRKDGSGRGGGCKTCVAVFVVFMVIAFGAAAFNLRNYMQSTNFYNYNKGDQVSLRHIHATDLSAVLCHKYKVIPWSDADVYLLDHRAWIDASKQTIDNKSLATGLFYADNSYNFEGFYLLPGSDIWVIGCREKDSPNMDVDMEVLVFKGTDSWNKWQMDRSCSNCAILTMSLNERDVCNDNRRALMYDVYEQDHYYVVVTRKYREDLHKAVYLQVNSTVTRSRYNLDSYRQKCTNTRYCQFHLHFQSHPDVVVEFKKDFYTSDAFFTTKCSLRKMFWAGVFGILPFVLILLITSCACCHHARSKRKQSRKDALIAPFAVSTNDRSGLVVAEHPPSYDAVNQIPVNQLPIKTL